MTYLRLLSRTIRRDAAVWVACALLSAVIALPAFQPQWLYGGGTLRESVATSLGLTMSNLASGAYDTAPRDLRDLVGDELLALQDADAATSPKDFYAGVLAYDELLLRGFDLGYTSGDRLLVEGDKTFVELATALDSPPEYGDSTHLPSLHLFTYALSNLPAPLLVAPALVSSLAVCSLTRRERLLGGLIVPASHRLLACCFACALTTAAVLVLSWIPTLLCATIRNGVGDPSYPIVFVQAGDVMSLTALEGALWTALLLLLGNGMLAVAAACVSQVTGLAYAGPAVAALLSLVPTAPGHLSATTQAIDLLPWLPTSFLSPADAVGYVGAFPGVDLAPACHLDPSSGCIVLGVYSIACLLVGLVCTAMPRAMRHGSRTRRESSAC